MQYIYDGSFEGFLSALTIVFRERNNAVDCSNSDFSIICSEDVEPLFPHLKVDNIPDIINSFGGYLTNHFNREMPDFILKAFSSDISGIENAIAEYILLARRLKCDPKDFLQISCVKTVSDACKRTTRETHKFLGLLRFKKIISNSNNSQSDFESIISIADRSLHDIYYAEFEPDTDCIMFLGEHFSDRFCDKPFIIADRRRSKCVIHTSGSDWYVSVVDADFFRLVTIDTLYEELWKKYFKVLSIPERSNPNLQRNNMPKKLWKHLIEQPGRQNQH